MTFECTVVWLEKVNGSVDQEMRENVLEYFKVFKLALVNEIVKKCEKLNLTDASLFGRFLTRGCFSLVSSVYDHHGLPLKFQGAIFCAI